jgi:hypothetical protein
MSLVKACELCGQEYEAYRPTDKYCRGCRAEGRRRRERVKDFALPALCPVSFVRKKIDKAPDGERIVIVSDLQFPFHDERTWGAVRRFVNDFQPNIIVWNGDVGDMYSISCFDKNPRRAFTFADEMIALRIFLFEHRARWASATHYFLFGNHEDRAQTYLRQHPELAGLVDLRSILQLIDFNVVPYGGVVDYVGLAITHGTRYSSLPNGTARMHAQTIGGSGVVGHSHRVGRWTYTDLRGTHTFYESGCLCRLDPDYIRQRPPNWQQGFIAGIVHRNKVHLHPMAIYDDGFYGALTGEFYAR